MQEFQAFDTTVIQVRSVLNFMYTLGYTLDTSGGRFVTEARQGQGNRYLSINTGVKLHNAGETGWFEVEGVAFPKCVKMQQGFLPLGVHLAMASKLVQQAKFLANSKGSITMQDAMIKPLNKVVAQLIDAE